MLLQNHYYDKKMVTYLLNSYYITSTDERFNSPTLGTSVSNNSTLFIDASKECVKVTNNNKLTDDNIASIVKYYTDRADVEHVAKLVPNSEVEKEDFNLSVSTYVEQEDTREVIDITELNKEIARIVEHEAQLRTEIDKIVAEIEAGV